MKVVFVLALSLYAYASFAQEPKAVSHSGLHWSPDGQWIAFSRMEITRSPTQLGVAPRMGPLALAGGRRRWCCEAGGHEPKSTRTAGGR